MENKETEYLNGDGDDFTIFLFSKKPMKPNTVKLQLNPGKNDIHIGLHIFQELLMIFTLGAKYLFSKNLKEKDIIMLVHGGHGFKVLKDVEMLEIKQGPYSLIKDKIKFDSVENKKIKLKK